MKICVDCGVQLVGRSPNCLRCTVCWPKRAIENRKRTQERLRALRNLAGRCLECATPIELSRKRCVPCQKARVSAKRRAAHQANPEKTRARALAIARSDPDRNRAKAAEWARANVDRHRQSAKLWRQTNPERCRSLVEAWCKRNPERVKELARASRERHRDLRTVYEANRRALLRGSDAVGVTRKQWLGICEQYNNRCAYCFSASKLTLEHFVPIARGGLNEPENVIPACLTCNASKGARTFLLWFGRHVTSRRVTTVSPGP